jgi:hypothetical protein
MLTKSGRAVAPKPDPLRKPRRTPYLRKWAMKKKPTRCSPEVMKGAARLVFKSREQYRLQWAATDSIARNIDYMAETLWRQKC